MSRTVRPAHALIRFVIGPEGEVVPDLRQRLPGRGVWVTAEKAMVAEAVKRKLFARAFKAEVKTSPTLDQEVEAGLRRDLLQLFALANKAGNVVNGFTKVESAIGGKDVAALLHAREAAEDGRRKLAGALRKRLGETISGVPVVTEFDGGELAVALGREHVIHAALVAGAGSDGFLTCWHRLRAYRGAIADEAGSAGGPVDLNGGTAGS